MILNRSYKYISLLLYISKYKTNLRRAPRPKKNFSAKYLFKLLHILLHLKDRECLSRHLHSYIIYYYYHCYNIFTYSWNSINRKDGIHNKIINGKNKF